MEYLERIDASGSSAPRRDLSVFYWRSLQSVFPTELGTPSELVNAHERAFDVVRTNSSDFAPIATYAHSLMVSGNRDQARRALNKWPNCTDWQRRDIHAAHFALLGFLAVVSKERRELCRVILRDFLSLAKRPRLDMNWAYIFEETRKPFFHELAIALRWGRTVDQLPTMFRKEIRHLMIG